MDRHELESRRRNLWLITQSLIDHAIAYAQGPATDDTMSPVVDEAAHVEAEAARLAAGQGAPERPDRRCRDARDGARGCDSAAAGADSGSRVVIAVGSSTPGSTRRRRSSKHRSTGDPEANDAQSEQHFGPHVRRFAPFPDACPQWHVRYPATTSPATTAGSSSLGRPQPHNACGDQGRDAESKPRTEQDEGCRFTEEERERCGYRGRGPSADPEKRLDIIVHRASTLCRSGLAVNGPNPASPLAVETVAP